MAQYTTANIIKLRDQRVAGLIEDVTRGFPLIQNFPAIAVSGTTYNHPNVTADAAGEFRANNAGKTATTATIGSTTVTLKYFDMSMGPLDTQVANADYNGPENAIAVATASSMRGGMGGLETQILYGTDATLGDASGFSGFLQLVDSSMVIDVEGTATAGCSDVWLVNYEQTKLILGNDGVLAQDDVVYGPAYDSSGNMYYAYSQNIGTWAGLTGLKVNGLARIKNIDTSSGHTLTDDHIYQALALFKVGHTPNSIVMSRRSLRQLRGSRTATNATGAPAPIPTEVEGLPIYVSDSCSDTIAAA